MIDFAIDPFRGLSPHSTTRRFNFERDTYDTRPLAKLAAAQHRLDVVDSSTMQHCLSVCPVVFLFLSLSKQLRRQEQPPRPPAGSQPPSHFAYAIGRHPSFTHQPAGVHVSGNGGFDLTLWYDGASSAIPARNITIRFLCDPEAVVGVPTAPIALAEHASCMLFDWRSTYVVFAAARAV